MTRRLLFITQTILLSILLYALIVILSGHDIHDAGVPRCPVAVRC